jgi:hypothetical protein
LVKGIIDKEMEKRSTRLTKIKKKEKKYFVAINKDCYLRISFDEV